MPPWPLVIAILAAPALAQDAPAPVHGITFDEYASASARLAAGRPMAEVLVILHVSRAEYDEAGAAFTQAMKEDTDHQLVNRFGQAFGSPGAGRFQGASDAPKPVAIASFEDYARIQGELTATVEAGRDPSAMLREQYGMTPFDWSQSSAPWVQSLRADDPALLRRQARVMAEALAEARARLGVRR